MTSSLAGQYHSPSWLTISVSVFLWPTAVTVPLGKKRLERKIQENQSARVLENISKICNKSKKSKVRIMSGIILLLALLALVSNGVCGLLGL